jgi:hypothetical protein
MSSIVCIHSDYVVLMVMLRHINCMSSAVLHAVIVGLIVPIQ